MVRQRLHGIDKQLQVAGLAAERLVQLEGAIEAWGDVEREVGDGGGGVSVGWGGGGPAAGVDGSAD